MSAQRKERCIKRETQIPQQPEHNKEKFTVMWSILVKKNASVVEKRLQSKQVQSHFWQKKVSIYIYIYINIYVYILCITYLNFSLFNTSLSLVNKYDYVLLCTGWMSENKILRKTETWKVMAFIPSS